MNSVVAVALSYLLLYKYYALFVITYFAALLGPLPAGTSLMAAGAFSTQGYFNFPIVVFVALAANVLGDLTGFFLARKFGKDFLIKIGLGKMLTSRKFIGLEEYIEERAPLTIFTTRFISQLGPLVNIFVGLSPLPFRTYFVYEFLGEFFYVMFIASIGYILGNEWQSAPGLIGFIITAVVITICAYLFSRSYFKALQKKK
jgi:membrane-associated protein